MAHHTCASPHEDRIRAPLSLRNLASPSWPMGLKEGKDRPESARRRRAGEIDGSIDRLAARQHGLVSVAQLSHFGLDDRGIRRRVERGRLQRIHQGVYAVGYRSLSLQGRWLSAVLACGPGAVVSHRSAAALWGIYENRRALIDVTAPNRRGRIPRGIDSHRDGSLIVADRTVLHGIPCTTVPRTLLDLAAVVPIGELRKAISEAEVLRLVDHDAVRRLIKRSRGRRGVARLRMLLDEIHPQTKRTRSELERAFLDVCVGAGLPEPEVNVKLEVDDRVVKPDFLWRDAGLILEADSRRFHDTDSAFQRDRKREQRLMLAGWQVVRCSWEQVEQEPRELAETVRRLLEQQGGKSSTGLKKGKD